MQSWPKARRGGFTLLELLVALVITALAVVLIMQGVLQALVLRERVLDHTQFQREDDLRRSWFRESVNSLMADLRRIERHQFRGDASGFSGLSLAPLQDWPGVPVPIQWQVENDDDNGTRHLYYSESGGERLRVWSWRAEVAEFSYFDGQLGWHDHWPPTGAPMPVLPDVIAFTTSWRGEPITWVANVKGSRFVRPGLELPPEFR